MADQQVVTDTDDLELEIVDDTPAQDKGRPPLSPEKVAAAEPTDEEMASYSEGVQKRIKQMKHALHDQRRAAEAAEREREAAIQYAQAMKTQAESLQQRYNAGERVFVDGMKDKAKSSIEAATAKLKAATEAFDAEAIAEATKEMSRAIFEEQRYEGWTQQNTGQPQPDAVQTRQTEPPRSPQVPIPDARAQAWAAKNQWFGADHAMTGFAYGVDAELKANGVTPANDPDEYYGEIDRRLRETFPNKFEDAPAQRAQTPQSTVAPVRRSASGKRVVTLTKSQESMAKRLGLTAAQYATSLIELENRNG